MSNFFNDTLSKQIFREELWVGAYKFPDTDPGIAATLLISTGAAETVFSPTISINGQSSLTINEGVSTSSDGTSVTNINMRRSSSETLLTTSFHTPTISAAGTLIYRVNSNDEGILPEATPFNADNGMILKANTKYAILANTQASWPLTVSMSWFLREI